VFQVQDTIEEKWKAIFKVFQKTVISCCNISKMVEFAMSLPGTSAPVERDFHLWGTFGLQKGVNFQYLLLNIC
jgi:hypothetical protein